MMYEVFLALRAAQEQAYRAYILPTFAAHHDIGPISAAQIWATSSEQEVIRELTKAANLLGYTLTPKDQSK